MSGEPGTHHPSLLDLRRAGAPVPFASLPNAWPVPGAATALCLSGELFGQMRELASLEYSHEGLLARCAAALEPGVSVAIGFQAPGYTAKRGVVRACQRGDDGYRLYVQFEARLAA